MRLIKNNSKPLRDFEVDPDSLLGKSENFPGLVRAIRAGDNDPQVRYADNRSPLPQPAGISISATGADHCAL